jgi:hypothetical protein
MAKIVLGKRPKNFKHTVKFPLLEGGEGAIECVYKYRTRSEFGEFIDGVLEAAKMEPQTGDDGQVRLSMKELMDKTAGANADYIMQVLDGWDVDAELTRANVQQLADELPAAAAAIMEGYRSACTEGRLGN